MNSSPFRIRIVSLLGTFLVGVLFFARAAWAVPFGSATIPNPLKATSIAGFFVDVINLFVFIGFIAAGFFIVYGGILLLTSLGNEEKLRRAKSVLTWAVIGLLVLLLAKTIEITIRNFLGI